MSYDIFAFDTGAVPTDEELLPWFREQAEWSEQRDYSSPSGSLPAIQALYSELIRAFPPLNGPDAAEEEPEDFESHAEYCIGSAILYTAFSWPKAEEARETFVRLGLKHGLGVCEVSESPTVSHRPAGEHRHTHVLRVNTSHRSRAFWLGPDPASARRRLAAEIDGLGSVGGRGEQKLNIIVAPLAAGREYDEDGATKEFLQTAGTAERLTVEVKRREPDGWHRHYVLGRPAAAAQDGESEPIRFGEFTQFVRPAEVLTAAEAGPLFQHYYDRAAIPDGWRLRELPEFADGEA